MKKTIIAIVVTFMATSAIFGFTIYRIEANHESEISELEAAYESDFKTLMKLYDKVILKNEELEFELADLSSDVYDAMTSDDYEIEIHKDGAYHKWTSEKVNWLFADKSYTITTVSSTLTGIN